MYGFSIYLASRTEQENQLLKRKIEPLREDFKGLTTVGLHPQGLPLSADDKIAAVVINVTEWSASDTAALLGLRSAGYSGPVLAIAKSNNEQLLKNVKAMDGVVFLEKPFLQKDLTGILKKMLYARAVAQRIHRRFDTKETAEIVPFGRNDTIESRVCNISKGGAYLEFASAAPLRIGDMVRVKVELKAVNRTYTVPARVVWTSSAVDPDAGHGAGVQFIGVPDVKKTMFGMF